MARTQSKEMTRAVAMVVAAKPATAPKDAAAACGVGLVSLYAALKRAGHVLDRSAATKRALADPAVRAKISEATKRALADPAVRAKMSAARKRALADPAVRAKMSAARKRAWAKRVVRKAAAPLTRQNINRAAQLLSDGNCVDDAALIIADALCETQQEAAK